jgi:hypothetical protein
MLMGAQYLAQAQVLLGQQRRKLAPQASVQNSAMASSTSAKADCPA